MKIKEFMHIVTSVYVKTDDGTISSVYVLAICPFNASINRAWTSTDSE